MLHERTTLDTTGRNWNDRNPSLHPEQQGDRQDERCHFPNWLPCIHRKSIIAAGLHTGL
jgi:hypothetical protein